MEFPLLRKQNKQTEKASEVGKKRKRDCKTPLEKRNLGMVGHTFYPNTQGTETGVLHVRDHPGLKSETLRQTDRSD